MKCFFIVARLLVLAFAVLPGLAGAQTYPDRPIKFIIPFPPGGGGDLMGRLLADSMAKQLGQPVVPENRPGSDQIVGTQALVAAPRDGYTVMLSGHTHLTQIAFQRKLPYEPMTDLVPVSRVAIVPVLLQVSPKLGAKSVTELVAMAKARPGQIKAGHIGPASTHNLSFKLIEQRSGAEFFMVPYKGSGPVLQALLSGEIDAMFGAVGQGVELDKAGKVVALGVSTKKRLTAFPNLTPLSEAGLTGFDFSSIFYLYVANGVPRPVITRLNRDLRTVLADAGIRGKLLGAGFEVDSSSPEEAATEHVEFLEIVTKLVKAGNLKWED